jgi:16S rRNA (cytidine1402-2'-O)-methyltransferase
VIALARRGQARRAGERCRHAGGERSGRACWSSACARRASGDPHPGASALTAALSASGIESDGVVFAGFLAGQGRERREQLARSPACPWAIVLFEAPHRIAATLGDLHARSASATS